MVDFTGFGFWAGLNLGLILKWLAEISIEFCFLNQPFSPTLRGYPMGRHLESNRKQNYNTK